MEGVSLTEPIVRRRPFSLRARQTLDSSIFTATKDCIKPLNPNLRHIKSLDIPRSSEEHEEVRPSFQRKTRACIERENCRHLRRPSLDGHTNASHEDAKQSHGGYLSARPRPLMKTFHRVSVSLKVSPLFRDCSDKFFGELSTKLSLTVVQPGHIFFKQGDSGSTMFIIGQGQVDIIVGETCVTTLTDGDIFGEMAVICKRPERRTATAVAKTLCDCRVIERDALLNLLDHFRLERKIFEDEALRRLNELRMEGHIEAPRATSSSSSHRPSLARRRSKQEHTKRGSESAAARPSEDDHSLFEPVAGG